ncbi:MAG: diguanylate phosphodiesterase [Rhodoferax ferrireducens]|uniref:Diguanylate phosphodiesterase n=1 Tax=Rhodoferax ferrireducens TaxID=192843 RepID=A0A1W9KQM5_9BURK|nr:MAG: diguanylate phosphodiesterase [Rhodoferax ferrireducens]
MKLPTKLRVSWQHSLGTRATVITLAVFVVNLWALSFYVSHLLRQDMQRVLGEQQFQTVSVVAAEVNAGLNDRLEALEHIATHLNERQLGKPAELQALLEQQPILQLMFNGGVFATDAYGTAIADVPLSVGRIGTNYMDRESVAVPLKTGKTVIGRPAMGKKLGAPIFSIVTPLRHTSGAVIGTLVATINLGQPNFLDKVTTGRYGKTGGYLLVAPQHQLFVTASDKSRIMQALPAAGINTMHDRYMQGFEGYGIAFNSRGVEELNAAKAIPVAGWFLGVVMPTAEAFSPIHDMQQRMFLATLLLTLMTGALTWWILQRELSPLVATADAMTDLANTNQIEQPLPANRQDEIGQLISGFNRILALWTQREASLKESQQNLAITLNSIGDAVIATDVAGRITHMNPVAESLTGWPLADGLGRLLLDVFHIVNVTTRQPVSDPVQLVMARGEVVGLANHSVLLARGGQEHHIADSAAPIHNAAGGVVGVVLVFSDVTEKYRQQEALRIAATAFESQQGTVITNAERVILQVNQAFTDITGYSAEEAVGQNPRLMKSGRHDNAYYAAMYQALENTGAWAGEIWNRRKNGEIYPGWLNISAVKDDTGLTTHFVGIFTDISQRLNAQAQIDSLAFYDPLTHLPNRRLLLDRLEQTLHTSTRHPRKSALLFVDLDNFKTLNDTLGHYQGDLLLMQVAQRLKTCIRDGDTVARLGSDEFVVMLEDLSADDIEAATQSETVADAVLQAFQQDFALDQGLHRSTPSIGITLFGGEALEGSEQPLKRAELAMFQAKAAGRNTLRFFDARMQTEVSAHAALEADLREAVAQQQFLLHYQPQVVGAGRITGVEALLRWQHPLRGLVPPGEFIPLAEETGLILPIGQWVLETACSQLAAWALQPELSQLTMAVNVSALQFKQIDFVDSVLGTLARSQANPHRLKLELTESMLVDNVEAIIAKMGNLKARGVTFSLDDFGTGYSSLAYLKRLPLDQLKIDQGFVRNIVTDTNDAAIARMVVALAESLGLVVIAEGVELQAQADFLTHLGCHAYQGYLFSKPLTAAAFEAFARSR